MELWLPLIGAYEGQLCPLGATGELTAPPEPGFGAGVEEPPGLLPQ